jgi:hypothetical protein
VAWIGTAGVMAPRRIENDWFGLRAIALTLSAVA